MLQIRSKQQIMFLLECIALRSALAQHHILTRRKSYQDLQNLPLTFVVKESIIASSIAIPPYLLNPSHLLHTLPPSPSPSPTHPERLRPAYLARPHAAP